MFFIRCKTSLNNYSYGSLPLIILVSYVFKNMIEMHIERLDLDFQK